MHLARLATTVNNMGGLFMNANTYWILVANSSEAKIFSAEKITQEWKLLKEFSHPESREKDTEIVADKFGSYPNIGTSGSSSYTEATDPQETEIENFARQLAHELNHGRTQNLFHKLVLVAPPRFHGMLNKHCDPHVLNLVINRLEKNYTQLKEHELIPRIQEQLKEF